MSRKKDGVFQAIDGTYYYQCGNAHGANYKNWDEAAQDYAKCVAKIPKYAEMLKGKTWREIYRILGLKPPVA